MAKVESTTITTTAACDTSRHSLCKSVVYTLSGGLDAPLQPCTCTCHLTDNEPAEEEDGGLDAYVELMIERELEDLHFDEGWS